VTDDLGCERVIVLDATVGVPALQFAATHPERTAALVLINPSACRSLASGSSCLPKRCACG
jgi:pimeloyl-ACP methyl ester carboxylesterase